MELPKVVSNRNHFVAIEDYADMLIRSPRSGFSESDRPEIMGIFQRMVRDIAEAMHTGAERGIEQAANLVIDNKFYEAKRSRRERSERRDAEERATEEANRQRRRDNPTIAEINESMRNIKQNIEHYEKALETCRGQIRYLQSRPAFLMGANPDRPNA